MRFLAPLSVLVVLLFPALAQAQPGYATPGQTPPGAYLPIPQLERPAPPTTKTVSYGMQVFMTDVAVWAVVAAASETDSEQLGSVAALGLFLGGPIVHVVNGNARGAVLSLVARGGFPVLGASLLASTCSESEQEQLFGCLGHVLLGGMIGYGTALAIDWFYLARKQERIETNGWASLAPTLNLRSDGAQAGVAYVF